jgi:hypothetical protein
MQPGWMIPAETLSREIFFFYQRLSGRLSLAQNVRPLKTL